MKKVLISILVLIVVSISCKKSSSTSSASLTATINGSSKSFNVATLATKSYLGGETAIEILGIADQSTGENIAIGISNALGGGVDSIVAGAISDTSTKFALTVTYTADTTKGIYYIGGSDVDGSEAGGVYSNHMAVTITSISNTAIKGTFSGSLYLNGDPTQAPYPVTNGSFSLPFTRQ